MPLPKNAHRSFGTVDTGYARQSGELHDKLERETRSCWFTRRTFGGDPVQNGISSSRSTSSGDSNQAAFGRLRKSIFSSMISQP